MRAMACMAAGRYAFFARGEATLRVPFLSPARFARGSAMGPLRVPPLASKDTDHPVPHHHTTSLGGGWTSTWAGRAGKSIPRGEWSRSRASARQRRRRHRRPAGLIFPPIFPRGARLLCTPFQPAPYAIFATYMFARLRTHFLTGLLVLSPVVITGYIIWKIFIWVDHMLGTTLRGGYIRPGGVPGLGFLTVMIIITLTGALAGNFLGRQ